MIRNAAYFLLFILSSATHASEWLFTKPSVISSSSKPGIFHHLESSGRKNISASNGFVAVTWEDNHQGKPAVYAAFKSTHGRFGAPVKISTGKVAYEPVITSIDNHRFLIAWEQDNYVWARIASAKSLSQAVRLDNNKSTYASLASGPDGQIHIVWSRFEGRFPRIVYTSLKYDDDKITTAQIVPVEPEQPANSQTYPSIAANNVGITVAWEDRRHGHTKLFYSHLPYNAVRFSLAKQLNEAKTGSAPFGRGPGVMRVALASSSRGTVAATWMDKRNYRSGYDIFGAVSVDGGLLFGANEKIQDIGGDNIPQWHPAIDQLDSGLIAVVWDDNRDDSPDILLSWRTANGWSEDYLVEPASGDGDQSNPAICFDDKGKLHIVWVNKLADKTNQLMYTSGSMINSN